jgi:hypothetical protein
MWTEQHGHGEPQRMHRGPQRKTKRAFFILCISSVALCVNSVAVCGLELTIENIQLTILNLRGSLWVTLFRQLSVNNRFNKSF